jgi:hypothetical protein
MVYTSKGVHSYSVDEHPCKVGERIAKKITGDTNERVKKNTLCKSCK